MDSPQIKPSPEFDYAAAELLLEAKKPLTGGQLASLIERDPLDQMPERIRAYLVRFLRGRRSPAAMDFIFGEAIELYDEKCAEFRKKDREKRSHAKKGGKKLPRAEKPAHERAAEFVLNERKGELGDMSAKRFHNLVAEWGNRPHPMKIRSGRKTRTFG